MASENDSNTYRPRNTQPNNSSQPQQDEKPKKSVGRRLLKGVGILTATGCLLGTVCLVGGYIYIKPALDKAQNQAYEKMSQIDTNTFMRLEDTLIYDSKGAKIAEINTSNYKYVNSANISSFIKDGYIAVEDNNFATHHGLDFKAIARAAKALYDNDGAITQGGSTITQQVLKNNVIGTDIDKWERKLIEFFLAPDFEKMFTKPQIMEFYCNSNFYGNGCYGVETASNYYFGKPARQLTLSEAAILVGISNSPSRYDPIDNPNECLSRRNFVLSRMLELGKITQSQYAEAKAAKLELVLEREAKEKENYQTSFAIHCGALKLMELDGFDFKYKFESKEQFEKYTQEYKTAYREKSEKIRNGGYTIYTTLDTDMQAVLQKSVDDALVKYTGKAEDGRYLMQGSATIVDNRTGFVTAVVGGRGTDDEYNRAFLSARQPGSAIKPVVVYGPAFDTGRYYPSLVMNDRPIKDGPKNAGGGYRGKVSIREAIARSLNTIPYNILQDLGPSTGVQYLDKMRFDNLSYLDTYNGSLALGGFTYGTTTFEMAKAYATIAMGGKYVEADCIKNMEFQGDNIYRNEYESTTVYSADTAYMLIDTMRGVVNERYGTAYGMKVPNTEVVGKTGTTNSNKDGWFCGISPYYSLAAWCGYDMPKEIPEMGGGKFPADIFRSAMTEIHKDLPEKGFDKPSTIQEVYVDWEGNKTERNTGRKDLFSLTGERRAEEDRRIAQEKADREKEEQRLREQETLTRQIETAIKELESMHIESRSDVTAVDTKRDSIDSLIARLDDKRKTTELEEELKVAYAKANRTDEEGKFRYELEEEKRREAEIEAERQRLEAERQRLEEIQREEARLKAEEERLRQEAQKQQEKQQAELEKIKNKPIILEEVNKVLGELENWKTSNKDLDSLIKEANTVVLKAVEYPEYEQLNKKKNALVSEILNYYNNLPYTSNPDTSIKREAPTVDANGNKENNESAPQTPVETQEPKVENDGAWIGELENNVHVSGIGIQ